MSEDQERSFGELVEPAPEEGEETREVVEDVEDSVEESQDTSSEDTTPVEETSTEEVKTEEPELTDKGTKLDPNPISAAHQQLANARRLQAQYEQVLSNPELLSKWQQERFGKKDPEPAKPELDEFTPDKLETVEDLAKAFNQIQSGFSQKSQTYEQKIAQLENVVKDLTTGREQERFASTLEKEVSSLKQAKEFDKNHPDYVEGLESEIVEMYEQLDFDRDRNMFKGQVSLEQVGKRMLEMVRKAKKSSISQANTIVKNKTTGKIITGAKKSGEVSTSSLSPEDSIASGIRKMFGNK